MKAFEEGGADQLLRETMEGHRVEPKRLLWKEISRKLMWKELLHFNFTNLSPKIWLAGAIGIFLVATTVYFGLPDNTHDLAAIKPAEKMITGNSPSKNIPALSSASEVAKVEKENTGTSPGIYSPLQNRSVEKSEKTHFEKGLISSLAAPDMAMKSKGQLSHEPVFVAEVSDGISKNFPAEGDLRVGPTISRIEPLDASLLYLPPGTDTIIVIKNSNGIFKFRKTSPVSTQFFSANLGFTPEVAFYSEPDVYSKTNFWLNGGATYHISRFSVATGFGLGYVYDDGKYRVEYKSNDSVGFFTGVTSYTIGTNNEMIYNTQTVNIYDSLKHFADSRTKNRYTYLQVPLLFGYRVFESGKVSLTFQVGPAISLLLDSRKSEPVIEYRNSRIIRVDNDTPSRIHTNWQIWANLYFEMRMNKNISLYLEPSFKYYLRPMVTRENISFKAPWTIGLGVGIQVNFGQKTKTP
ncbi:MAG: outer membrane beta-barrel protein [Bacteroidales bacterium]|nr:outer membrane beta-barrel protein [Bacteroidales bacterium]